jgi:hypothetical protein
MAEVEVGHLVVKLQLHHQVQRVQEAQAAVLMEAPVLQMRLRAVMEVQTLAAVVEEEDILPAKVVD